MSTFASRERGRLLRSVAAPCLTAELVHAALCDECPDDVVRFADTSWGFRDGSVLVFIEAAPTTHALDARCTRGSLRTFACQP